eukprot:jgi/Mesen1/931/ME000118S00110
MASLYLSQGMLATQSRLWCGDARAGGLIDEVANGGPRFGHSAVSFSTLKSHFCSNHKNYDWTPALGVRPILSPQPPGPVSGTIVSLSSSLFADSRLFFRKRARSQGCDFGRSTGRRNLGQQYRPTQWKPVNAVDEDRRKSSGNEPSSSKPQSSQKQDDSEKLGAPTKSEVASTSASSLEPSGPEWLRSWEVPWNAKKTTLGMTAWFLSFILSSVLVQVTCVKLGWYPWKEDLDHQALFILFNQLLRTVMGLWIVYAIVKPYQPLPPNFFKYDLGQPFKLNSGWLLWGIVGFVGALGAVEISALTQTFLEGHELPREEADALVQLLPIIGASPLSTASLLVVAGVCAPILEETIFRGFFMTSLTKWMPVPVAALISAAGFAAAHLTPGDFPKLASLGFVLGLSYAKTRNLMTPIFMHALWNSGIIIFLTILRMEGYDIDKYL